MEANEYFENLIQIYEQFDITKPICKTKNIFCELDQVEPGIAMYECDNSLRISTQMEYCDLANKMIDDVKEDDVTVVLPKVIYSTNNDEEIEEILNILSDVETNYIDLITSLKRVVNGDTMKFLTLTK